jgi:hypothetical protein
MAKSLEAIKKQPTTVEAGLDDRSTQLHPARFLGGAVCSAKRLWQAARDVLGIDGVPPLASYDMTAVGLMGCVTARGWKELHNPASMNLTVKLFSPTNMASSTGSTRQLSLADGCTAVNVGESLREIADLEELKLAVRAMCRAAHMALPWNQSFNAIEGFLLSSDWVRQELSGRSNRAAILADFVNYVLGLNAQAWLQKDDFRSSGEIKILWAEWFASRPASLLTVQQAGAQTTQAAGGGQSQQASFNRNRGANYRGRGNKFSFKSGRGGKSHPTYQAGGGGGGGGQGGGQQAPSTGGQGAAAVPAKRELYCWKFNNGNKCPNPANACVLGSGAPLLHLCDAYTSQGVICKKNHPRSDHH